MQDIDPRGFNYVRQCFFFVIILVCYILSTIVMKTVLTNKVSLQKIKM